MLEKPDIPDERIIACIQDEYGLRVDQLNFLPLGADINTAVYHVAASNGTAYFFKLRKGGFDEATVEVPQFLYNQGNKAIIPLLSTRANRLWGDLAPYKVMLYPFIEGKNGYEMALTDQQWIGFGEALKKVHTTQLPPALKSMVKREDFTPQWREMVKSFQVQIENSTYTEPTAAKMAASMKSKRETITHLVVRAEQLAVDLLSRPLNFVLCHFDIHAGNLLLTPDERLYIVDWDNPLLAPKERDLMFIGGSGTWHDPRESGLFYQGYGSVEIDQAALAYYRYERIVEDIAVECEGILQSTMVGEDREQEYKFFLSNFAPGSEIEIALNTDPQKGA